MNQIESAVVYLSSICDGATEIDGAGWNKFDSHLGKSLADQIQTGKSLSVKQRAWVANKLRKYRRQLSNWEEIKDQIPPWVEEAHKIKETKKKKTDDNTPRLEYCSKQDKFLLFTSYETRHLAKQVPRGRWIGEFKAWRYLNNEETITALIPIRKDLKAISPEAEKVMKSVVKKQIEREESLEEVKEIKLTDEVEFSLPLKTSPFDHQKKAIKIATTLDHSALLMEQGTGKTLAAIGAAVHRYLKGEVKRILVIAPKSVLPEWSRQLEEHTDLPYQAASLDVKGSKKKEILSNWEDEEGINLIAINYESTWRLEKELIAWKPDLIICDESQKIKNSRAKQTKAIVKIGAAAKYRMVLTGTPVSQSPLDFFGQYLFLDSKVFGRNYVTFRDQYAIMGGFENHQIVDYKNLEDLTEKAHSIAYRVTKKEAVDLPPETSQFLYTELESSADKLYKEMEKEALLELEGGKKVTAPIALTKLLRLQQIAGGFLRPEESEEYHQVSKAKLNLLIETLDDLLEKPDRKVVIFAKFLEEVKAISDHLKETGIKFQQITGATRDRKTAINDFQNNPETKIFIAQIATGGVGITLTAADTAIFYSTGYSLIDYEQAKARIHRIGQVNDVNYIHMITKGTVDEEVVNALSRKKDIANLVVDELKNILLNKSKEEFKMAKKKKLDQKLEELRGQIEEGVEVEELEEEVTEEVTEDKPTKKKEKKEKAPKEETEGEEVVTVQDLAEELDISATVLRKKLRTSDLEKPAGRWEWTLDHPDLEVIRSWKSE